MQIFFKSASIAAASQFQGNELAAMSLKPNRRLRVKEIMLSMGSEAKTYAIQKVFVQGGTTVRMPLRAASASTDTSVVLTAADADFVLLPGEQIQVQTSGATSAMHLRVQYQEESNEATRSELDPKVTR